MPKIIASVGLSLFILALVSATPGEEQTSPPVQPAKYKAEGEFAGGKPLPGAILTGIRFGKHEGFTRLVLDFAQEKDGKRLPAPYHPPYRIVSKLYPYRYDIVLEGVTYAPDATVQSKHALPLTIVTTNENLIKLIQVFISTPALFKVIEIDDPAKLSLDVKPLPVAPIPWVYAVQLRQVKDVESAFRLLEEPPPAFREANFQPEVIVLGSAVFVEAVYETEAEASAVAEKLERAGFPTLVTERQGSEVPRF